MAEYNKRADRYANTPRKIFDAHIDKQALRRERDLQDHRADLKALIQRLTDLDNRLTHLVEHQKNTEHDLGLLEDAISDLQQDTRDS